MNQVTPTELAAEIAGGNTPSLLDVREADELEISQFAGALHIPVGEIPARWTEVDPTKDWIVVCRSGIRSQRAVDFLRAQGYEKVRNLATGINGWAKDVDPSLPVY